MSASKGTAVVTGASSGIGAIYADRLAKRGYDLILVARNEERLKDVAARIASTTGRSVTILPADLNDRASLAKVESVLKENPAVTMLVNNAGFGSAVPLLQSDIGKMVEMIDLNVTALTRLAYAVAPAFASRGKGTIINISSIVGIAPELLNGVYGGSKAYVLAFSQSLQHELADKGVRIQVVLPGATATEFWDIAGFPHSNMPSSWVMSAEDMVDAALAGLDNGEVVTIPALQDAADWEAYEAARKAMSGKLSNVNPAPRYGIKAAQTA
ncbi:SDR family oxidoreductase [Hyphomicrobium sp. B1]|uniref:SDR family NAD(P)-dependent oxidoreductase n=1 Tax=unclassified Hyphomicrobium TaxID=2619925 RepID=UPI00391D8003